MSPVDARELLGELERLAAAGGYSDQPTLRRVGELCAALRGLGGPRDKLASVELLFAELYSARRHEKHADGIRGLRSHLLADIWAVQSSLHGRAP